MKDMYKENKYYFFNPNLISHTKGTTLKQGSIQKLVTNANWVDQHNWTPQSGIPDWEHRVSILYPNVEYDAEKKKYKIWYHAFHRDSPVDEYYWTKHLIDKNNSNNVDLGTFANLAKGVIHQGHDVLCYMESMDGVNWVRPDLGEFYYQTRTGEIIGTNIVYVGMHGLGVKKNENPNEPKYLMAGRTWDTDSLDARGEPIGVAISFSEDGFHWEDPITIKTAYDCAPDLHYIRADTHNQLLWSAERGKYVVITRGYTKGSQLRTVAYMESTNSLQSIRDLLTVKKENGKKYWENTAQYWSCPETVLDRQVTLDAQPYSMPVAHVADGCYIGVASIVNFDESTNGRWNSVHAQLTWSQDAKDWNYIDKGTPFIDNAPEFSLVPGNDYGMIYSAAPVNTGNRTQIFYAAISELHYVKYDQIPENIKEIVDEQIPLAKKAESFTRTSSLNIAQFNKDCYAGLTATDGAVTTSPFEVTGSVLKITAEIAEGGSLRIDALDSDGNVIPGYEASVFTQINANGADQPVSWSENDLTALKGQTVSFRCFLNNATLYTISGNISILRKGEISK